MKIDIRNFARYVMTKDELQWFVMEQLPAWIREMLRRKREGEDPAKLIDELAEVCCIEEEADK